jgi:hypothetical protein
MSAPMIEAAPRAAGDSRGRSEAAGTENCAGQHEAWSLAHSSVDHLSIISQ